MLRAKTTPNTRTRTVLAAIAAISGIAIAAIKILPSYWESTKRPDSPESPTKAEQTSIVSDSGVAVSVVGQSGPITITPGGAKPPNVPVGVGVASSLSPNPPDVRKNRYIIKSVRTGAVKQIEMLPDSQVEVLVQTAREQFSLTDKDRLGSSYYYSFNWTLVDSRITTEWEKLDNRRKYGVTVAYKRADGKVILLNTYEARHTLLADAAIQNDTVFNLYPTMEPRPPAFDIRVEP